MNLIRSHGLLYVWVPQEVPNMIFTYSWRDFTLLLSFMPSID